MDFTIVEAIVAVLKDGGAPMTVWEIHRSIKDRKIYEFKAENEIHVVRSQIRRHCFGLDFPSAQRNKRFIIYPDGKFGLHEQEPPAVERGSTIAVPDQDSPALSELRAAHGKYMSDVRRRLLEQLKDLSPRDFERFARNLLTVYGFTDAQVTRTAKDSGIDGHGRLKVGIGSINSLVVAFQCKRWTKRSVGRSEIAAFRGSMQGTYAYGIFFTTAAFSREAQQAADKPGALPVVLMDGRSIVDLMIEKKFGVEVEPLPLYRPLMDLALGDIDE